MGLLTTQLTTQRGALLPVLIIVTMVGGKSATAAEDAGQDQIHEPSAELSQDTAALTKPGPKPCQGPPQRAFDFWLGEWQVTTPSRPDWQALSKITVANDGCSIHEAYSTPGGYRGTSVNFYDKQNQQWHQTWIDNQGNPLFLKGGIQEGSMVLSDGVNEITWTALPDGRVRQHWRNLAEPDAARQTVFDGYYQRVP